MYFSGSISEPKFQNLRLLSFHNFSLMNLFCYWFWPRTFVNGGRRLSKRYYTRGDNIHWHWDILNDRLNWHRGLIQWKVSTNYILGLKEYLFFTLGRESVYVNLIFYKVTHYTARWLIVDPYGLNVVSPWGAKILFCELLPKSLISKYSSAGRYSPTLSNTICNWVLQGGHIWLLTKAQT